MAKLGTSAGQGLAAPATPGKINAPRSARCKRDPRTARLAEDLKGKEKLIDGEKMPLSLRARSSLNPQPPKPTLVSFQVFLQFPQIAPHAVLVSFRRELPGFQGVEFCY